MHRDGDWPFEIDFASAAPDIAQDQCFFTCNRKTSEGMDTKDIRQEQGDVLVIAAKSFAMVRMPQKSVGLNHQLPRFMMKGEIEPQKIE